ncbi:hypothetical protein Hanom_Chr06g00505931 [Helianthus anomalus]
MYVFCWSTFCSVTSRVKYNTFSLGGINSSFITFRLRCNAWHHSLTYKKLFSYVLSTFRYKSKLVYVSTKKFSVISQVKYNTFSCLFSCAFLDGLHFDVNFVRKRVGSNI